MKIKQFTRSSLALLLILASLVSLVPAVFAAEEEDRQQVTINASDLVTEEEFDSPDAEAQGMADEMTDLLCEEYGVETLAGPDYGDPEFPCLPEDQGPATKADNLSTSYVFLDFKAGSKSRDFNWQGQSATPKFSSPHPSGLINASFSGTDSRIYMGIENTTNGKKRLGNYVIQTGDIIQVRIHSTTANSLFVANGNSTNMTSYFTICTSGTIDATTASDRWVSCGSATITGTTAAQILQFKPKAAQVGQTLHAVRWDPLQNRDGASYDFPATSIYIDYIYVGPVAKAPVSVVYRNEANTANLSHTMTTVTNDDGTKKTYSTYGFVGYGQVAPYFDNGKTNSETSTTQTIWGYQVYQDTNKDGTFEDMNKFITDPTTFKCYYNTRFVLKSVTIRKETLNSKQTYSNGTSTEDDKYVLTCDGFDTAEMDLGKYGTPLDVTIVLDRSGSESDLASGKKTFTSKSAMTSHLETLDKTKWPGYYRASCWRMYNSKGGSGAKAYVYHMPMRYYNGQWQCLVIPETGIYPSVSGNCNCDGKHADYGVYPYNANGTGMNYCSHVKWVSMSHAYSLYEALLKNEGYSSISSAPYEIGVCRLGVMQNSIKSFVDKLFNSTKNLKAGQRHSISILSYGHSVFIPSYPYNNQNGSTVKPGNNADCSLERIFLDENGYQSFISKLRETFVFGTTRTDAAFQLLAGQVSDIETAYNSNRTTPYISSSKYIRAASTSRKRIVILLTDGVPTKNTDFDTGVANKAVKASAILKDDSNTKVYALACMSYIDSSISKIGGLKSSSDNANKANDFLNSISSRYRNAAVWNTGGALTAGNYYMSSNSAGNTLATSMETLWSGEAPTLTASGKSGPASLWLYEDYGREWKPDPAGTVKIYAEAYTGNGAYSGTKILIGEHKVTDHTKNQDFTGNGYILHYYYDSTDQSFTYALQWTDAKTAFLRETELSTGSKAKAVSGSLNTKKGYKVYMEMPIEVDRNNTLGGNNIPLTTSTSGCYQAKDATDKEIGTKLYNYYQPNANVFCSVDSEAHDYFISLEDYIALMTATGTNELKTVLDQMLRLPDNLKPANEHGVSNLKYLSFDVQLKAPNGTVMYHQAAEQNAITLKTSVSNITDAMANLAVDQTFTMVSKMTYSSHNTDDYGRPPYSDIDTTFYPTYYVPKFAVVDYGDDICVPMGLEGQNYSRISGLPEGALNTTTNEVQVDDGGVLINDVTSIPYTYNTVNIPKGATSNVVSREVTILPGNVVTYDDDVLTYAGAEQLSSKTEKWTSKITGKEKTRTIIENRVAWTTMGSKSNIVQTFDNMTSHGGYDAKYASTGNFHGSVMVATVGETKNYDTDGELIEKVSNSTAQTQFTFKGTGFEIISRTTRDSGVLLAEVFSGTSIGANATPVKSILCNTYLSTADYNQAPVIRWTGGYGEYTVRLTAYYNVAFAYRSTKNAVTEEEAKAILGYDDSVDFTYIESKNLGSGKRGLVSSYNVYIDGIRVFNPLNQGDTVSQNIYSLAKEGFANFGDIQNIVLDSTNWKGGQATGMLFLADRNSNVGNNAEEEQLGSENGFPLFMNGELSYEKVGAKTYFKDENGNRIKDPATGYDIYSTYVDGSYKYRIDKATKTQPYTELSRDYVRSVLINYSGYFYNKIYRSNGAKNEVQLQNGQGVAFAADAGALHLSLKSANGVAVKVEVWNGSEFVDVDYTDPDGNKPLTALTSTTEMFYDFSKYKGLVILKNAGSGILSICQVKYVDDVSPISKGIYIDEKVALAAMAAFEEAEPVTELDSLKLSHSLNLQSNIGINYILPKAAVADFDHYALTCTVGEETYVLTGSENGELIYFTLDCLTAAQMNDNVRAVLNATKGDECFVSPADDYSIATYAFTMMNKEGVSEQIKSLCANLLRYGAATQTFLGKTEAGLADEEMTAEQREWLRDLETVEFGNSFAILEDVAEPTVNWVGKTLALDSTIAVKFVVDATAYAGDPVELELRVAYTGIDGEAKELTLAPTVYNEEKHLYMFTLDQLDAAELRAVLTCQVLAAGEAVSQTMTYSADSYANGKTGTLLELCKALFAYVDEAKAVFAG